MDLERALLRRDAAKDVVVDVLLLSGFSLSGSYAAAVLDEIVVGDAGSLLAPPRLLSEKRDFHDVFCGCGLLLILVVAADSRGDPPITLVCVLLLFYCSRARQDKNEWNGKPVIIEMALVKEGRAQTRFWR